MGDLYDRDFYRWAAEQATVMRNRRFELEAIGVDWTNVAEELEALGKSETRELRNRFVILLLHLLKWQHQPLHQSESWRLTINEQREAIADLLADSPSLTHLLDRSVERAYRDARRRAAVETGLPHSAFPVSCPWTSAQTLEADFLP